MKNKLLVGLVGIALLVGVLSGCVEEEKTTPENTAPEAMYTWEAVGLMVTFDASDSTDEDEDDLTYAWYIDDVLQEDEVAVTFEYTFAASGTYTVKLMVNDGTVDSEAYSEDIAVTNPPTVVLGDIPETITNTTEITFTATVTEGDATVNDTTGYAWYIDDVMQEGETTSTFAYTFEDGTYEVKVMVTDDDGLTGSTSISFTVPTEA